MNTFESIDPNTEEVFAKHEQLSDAAVEGGLTRAFQAQVAWRGTNHAERSAILIRFAEVIQAHAGAVALMATREMGKPIAQARAEVLKCANLCRHYAENSARYLAAEEIVLEDAEVSVRPEPLGVILSITPWNFPAWQIARLAIPAIAAGNAVMVKPAPNVIGTGELFVQLGRQAGLPDGLFQSLPIDHLQAEKLMSDRRIAAVGLTGSERAGARVAAIAGAHLKKVVLELGGSDPFIVLEDADIPAAAKAAVEGRFQNCGQVCIAAKRFIVEARAYSTFRDAFVAEVESLRLGDPRDESVFLGPMARADLRDEVARQVEASISQGARVLLRGGTLDRPGYFYRPTVLEGGCDEIPLRRDEVFGPATILLEARNREAAVTMANDTRYGLSASLWTGDIERAVDIVDRLETGAVFLNSVTRSHPAVPFGGIKASGFGRELGREGAREYTNLKTVSAPHAGAEKF